MIVLDVISDPINHPFILIFLHLITTVLMCLLFPALLLEPPCLSPEIRP